MLIDGVRVKTVRSHLSVTDLATLVRPGAVPAGPGPLPPIVDGVVVEVDQVTHPARNDHRSVLAALVVVDGPLIGNGRCMPGGWLGVLRL